VGNVVKDYLIKLGLSSDDSFEKISDKVRDRDDVSVLRCMKSGVILLNSTEHITERHYSEMDELTYWGENASIRESRNICYEDNFRRYNLIKEIVSNKKYLDFGTGSGGILEMLSSRSKGLYAIELQNFVREKLNSEGFKVYKNLEDIQAVEFDIVTFFHVLEHLIDPVKTLKEVKDKMKTGAKIIVEVPSANDFLISFLDNEPFKNFTFWSEHLILHTRESLKAFLKESGFGNIEIKGVQRYPLSNHLYWLSKGNPGGHQKWNFLNSKNLTDAYEDLLNSLDKTDTLIAFAEKL